MPTINTNCYISCSHCGNKRVTSTKPVVHHTFTCSFARWETDPTLKCPNCGMPKSVIVVKKIKVPKNSALVDNYERDNSKGLKLVAMD